jgi:hypothetical protein
MRLPIDPTRTSLLAISEPEAKLEFGQLIQKVNSEGVGLWTIAVLISGTGERQDPTVKVTLASADRPAIKRGDSISARNLTARTWTMRDNQGRERSGVSFETDAIEVVKSR